MSWKAIRLGDAYREASRNGVYKPKQHHGSGVPIVNMGELFAYDVIGSQPMKRLEMNEKELVRAGLEENDLLFGRRSLVEAGAGKSSIVRGLSEPTTFESSIIRVRLDDHVLDPKYAFYWFRSPAGKGAIRSIVTGTTVKGIKGSLLQDVEVAAPSLENQKEIADRLSAYDDLIENNRRRMELLEASARHLYEEWFVRLRFPGREHTPIKHGVPKGWEKVNLKDVCEDKTGIQTGPFGSQLHQSDYVEEGNPVVMPKNILGSRIDTGEIARVPDEITNRLSKHKLVPGDIVLARRGDIGRKSLVTAREEGWLCGTGCMRLRPKQDLVTPRLLFETLGRDEVRGELIARAGGSIMPNLNLSILSAIEFVNPPHPLQVAFSELMHPWHEQISNLDQQNVKLKAARDHLLPRLMSGEVPV